MLFRLDSVTGGWQTNILQVYTQRFRASNVLQYTLEHLERETYIYIQFEKQLNFPLQLHVFVRQTEMQCHNKRFLDKTPLTGTLQGRASVYSLRVQSVFLNNQLS